MSIRKLCAIFPRFVLSNRARFAIFSSTCQLDTVPYGFYRRVAIFEDFFDIIQQIHAGERQHVGMARSWEAIKDQYTCLPRHVVRKYVDLCPDCHPKRAQVSPQVITAPLQVSPQVITAPLRPFLSPKFTARCKKRKTMSTMATKCCMVLDTDVGVDDAVALLMALSQPTVDLIGITCVHGNTSLSNVLINTLRVLKICDRLDIPVFKGASSPLIGQDITDEGHYHHGNDGMGGVPDPDPPSRDLIQSEHAVNALIRLANERPGEITLVAIGPLTNLALAVKMDPDFSKKLKELVIMGGNVEGCGNKWPGAEFNFRIDPEAAHIVLQEFKCNITIVPWESCLENNVSWAWYDKWMSTDTVKGRFVADILKYATKHSREIRKRPRAHICDALAMAVTVNRSMVTKMIRSIVRVELRGEITRGQMVQMNTGWRDCDPSEGNEVDVVIKCTEDVLKDMLTKAVE